MHVQLSSVSLSVVATAGGRQSGGEVEEAISVTVVDTLSDVITYSSNVTRTKKRFLLSVYV